MPRRFRQVVLGIATVLIAFVGCAQARADHRIALIIGNSNYLNTPPLANPINDATDIAEALKSLGFAVRLQLDANKRDFDHDLEAFARDARGADAALVYYAGHGLQYHGENYLMPVDAALRDDVSLRYEMVDGRDIISALQESTGVKILILDACRDNPLAKRLARSVIAATRGGAWAEGLAKPGRISGMVVVYATQADEVAHDGEGRNSPFAAAFLKALKIPGLEIGALFRRVEAQVEAETDGQQSPELSISLAPEFYINMTETDQELWARVRQSSDMEAIKSFIRRYPTSFYTPDAELLLKSLEAPASAPHAALLSIMPTDQATPAGVGAPATEKRLTSVPPTQSAKLEPHAVTKAIAPPSDFRFQINAELRRLGCAAPGAGTQAVERGLTRYASVAHLARALQPSAALLEQLAKRPAHFCSPQCGSQEIAANGRCIRKPCNPNMRLSRSGVCVARIVRPQRTPGPDVDVEPRQRWKPSLKILRSGTSQCITFDSKRMCE
jgi:hypothetical protein